MASDVPVLDTYQAVVSAYIDFLTVAIHTILYERNIYPQASFIKARKYNSPVRQSRHPKVCKWIQDAAAAVEAEMLKSTIARTSLIIHAPPPTSQPLERHVFSTTHFPRIPPSETLTPFTTTTTHPPPTNNQNPIPTPPTTITTPLPHPPPPASNLPEQFRATLSRLGPSLAKLAPLPDDCSFTLAIELRDESGVEAPLGREGAWVAAEPGLQYQRRGGGREAGEGGREEGEEGKGRGEGDGEGEGRIGRDLGGVRTTPVRRLEAGAFRMEVWVEEGKGKFGGEMG